jgi:pyridoxine 4-dehydrogenase
MGGSFALGSWRVHRVGYGAMELAGDEAPLVLRAAVESGVNHIDTAQYYGPVVVNELIREALYPYPSDVAIVSKVAARRKTGGAALVRASRPTWTPLAPAGWRP